MTNHYINKELKKLLADFNADFARAAEDSRHAYMRTLRPGVQVPAEGRLYSAEDRIKFDETAKQYRHKAADLIKRATDELKSKAMAAPTSEAVNTIAMLNARQNVPEGTFADLLEKYSENPQTYDAIVSIAHERGYRQFSEHPVTAARAAADGLAAALDKTFTLQTAEAGKATAGYTAFIGMSIDEVFPDAYPDD